MMDLNFDNERELLTAKRAELLEGVANIDRALAALGQMNGAKPKAVKVVQADGVAADGKAVRAGRKPMSAKARKAAKERMLAYWADKRKAEAKAAKSAR